MSEFSFKNWLSQHEDLFWENLRDISKLPLDAINLEVINDVDDDETNELIHTKQRSEVKKYISKFSVGQDNFTVYMDRISEEFQDIELLNVFSIVFHGPQSYNLTRDNSTVVAREKYNLLLASVAKMVQAENQLGFRVNGFEFGPYEKEMKIMYEKFYKDYLKPAGYLKVESEIYLHKDYIREVLKGISEKNKKKSALGTIVQTSRDERKNLSKVRMEKKLLRSAKSMLNSILGSVVLFKTSEWSDASQIGLVTGIRTNMSNPIAYIATIAFGEVTRVEEIPYQYIFNQEPDDKNGGYKLMPASIPKADQVIKLLKVLQKAPGRVKPVENQFRQLLRTYGLTTYSYAKPNVQAQRFAKPPLAHMQNQILQPTS